MPRNRKNVRQKTLFTIKPLVLALHASIGLGFVTLSTPVLAGASVESSAEKTYNIPAGPLGQSLNRFAAETGITLSYKPDLVAGKRAPELTGTYPTEQALNILLKDADLIAVSDDFGYRLARKPNQSAPVPESENTAKPARQTVVTQNESKIRRLNPMTVEGRFDNGFIYDRNTSATKTDTPIIETPQSISVISSDEMSDRGVRDIADATAYSAGVFAGNSGETSRYFGGNSIQIRGYGGGGTAGSSFNEYVDGLKMRGTQFAESNLDSYLFERVEVLKGPASVLYGQTQPGGIVNTISKRPDAEMENEIVLGTGNLDKRTGAIDVGGELNENITYRVTAKALDGDAHQDHSDRERLLFAPSLTWQNDDTSITFLSHYQRDNNNATILNGIPDSGLFRNPNGDVSSDFRVGDPGFEKWKREVWSVGYAFEHSFNDALTFRQNLRYTHNELESDWLFRSSLGADRRTLQRSAFIADEDSDHFAIDNQLQWQFDTGSFSHTLLGGVDYQHSSNETNRFWGAASSIDIFEPAYNQVIPQPPHFQNIDRTLKQLGIYVQDQIKIGNLSLLAGGRWDDARSESDNLLNDTSTHQDDDAFTARAGAIYNFENGFAPYVSYSESFEPSSGNAFDGSQFEPTEAEQYEVGIKYQPADKSQLFTLSWFDLTQENVVTSDPNNPGFNVQTGEIKTRGFELEGKTNYAEGLNLIAAYTYLDDEITESNNGDEGDRRPQIPRHTASLWADYTFSSNELSGLGLGLGVRYIGEAEFDGEVVSEVPSYTLFDASLRYDLGATRPSLSGWSVNAYVNNLFDKEYVASCSNANICFIGESTTFSMSISKKW